MSRELSICFFISFPQQYWEVGHISPILPGKGSGSEKQTQRGTVRRGACTGPDASWRTFPCHLSPQSSTGEERTISSATASVIGRRGSPIVTLLMVILWVIGCSDREAFWCSLVGAEGWGWLKRDLGFSDKVAYEIVGLRRSADSAEKRVPSSGIGDQQGKEGFWSSFSRKLAVDVRETMTAVSLMAHMVPASCCHLLPPSAQIIRIHF